jgi:hypothetical protein
MTEITLTGLDGKNPVAFLAALGTLGALTEQIRAGEEPPRLRWIPGTWRPVLTSALDRAGVLAALAADLATFQGEPAVARLRYDKGGDGAEAHDLKPPPAFFVQYLRDLVAARARRSLGFAAAFATDVAVDGNGNAKPTALHFTAGQQEFLGMIQELIGGVTLAHLDEALFGPWRYEQPLPVLGWDNAQSRDYALRAGDPSKDKKLGVPGADWLAFRGLPLVRVAPIGDRIETTGCQGSWKTGTFRWPLWTGALPRTVIGSLLASPELLAVNPETLAARGIAVVLEAAIRRSDQGGYGSFAPARVAERRR